METAPWRLKTEVILSKASCLMVIWSGLKSLVPLGILGFLIPTHRRGAQNGVFCVKIDSMTSVRCARPQLRWKKTRLLEEGCCRVHDKACCERRLRG